MAKKTKDEAPKDNTRWEEAAMAPSLTKREQELRDKFVTQYLIDNHGTKAAIRVGFGPSFAAEYATRFLNEAYVQQQIELRKTETAKKLTKEEMEDRVRAKLLSVMDDVNAPYPSIVAATAKLATILGMDAPIKKELSGPNGTPLVPTTLQVYFDDDPD